MLEQARRQAFPDFDRISLEPAAMRILANLFVNPDCNSDADLAGFVTQDSVLLKQISLHIITAAPSTLAKYAQDHNRLEILEEDILRCFALDHAEALQENKIDRKYSPAYALAHLLNVCRVDGLRNLGKRQLVRLVKETAQGRITFSDVVVPENMKLKIGQLVFQHFGVVVALAHNNHLVKLAETIEKKQREHFFTGRINQQTANEIIDSQDKRLFHENLLEKIIKGKSNLKKVKLKAEKTAKGKIIFQK